MPIREYRCTECAQLFEEWQKDFDVREIPCPVCGSMSESLVVSASAGKDRSRWFVTDYCGRDGSPAQRLGGKPRGQGPDRTRAATDNGS